MFHHYENTGLNDSFEISASSRPYTKLSWHIRSYLKSTLLQKPLLEYFKSVCLLQDAVFNQIRCFKHVLAATEILSKKLI